jgi:Glycosyltransferase family 87
MISRRRVWALSLFLIAILYVFAFYRHLPTAPASFADFSAYYLPTAQMLRGRNPYFTYLGVKLVPADTPTWMLCFEPLATLTSYTASWTWFWINVAALTLSLYLLIREAGFEGDGAVIVAAIGIMYPPIASNLWFGQSEVFLCLFLVLMLVALRHRRDSLAGLFLAAASLLRAYPIGLIGYLFVLRRWKALGWTAIWVIIGGLITTLFVGWHMIETYLDLIGISRGIGLFGLTSTLKVPTGLMKHPANLNLGWFVKWLYDRTASRPVPIAVSIFGALAEVAAVAVCFHATLGIDSEDPDWRGFGIWIVTLSLISPLSWYFYFCCFLPLIIGMAAAWRRSQLSPFALYAMGAAYLVSTLVPSYGHPLYPLFSSATEPFLKNHVHIDHVLSEKEFAALILTWLAAYLFVTDTREFEAPAKMSAA